MIRQVFFSAAILVSAGLLSGCENPPDGEIQAARSAIQAARNAGGEKTAFTQFSRSVHLLDSALQDSDFSDPVVNDASPRLEKNPNPTSKEGAEATVARAGAAQGQPGFVRDYNIGFNSSSPFMSSALGGLTAGGSHGQGRFVRSGGGWNFYKTGQD